MRAFRTPVMAAFLAAGRQHSNQRVPSGGAGVQFHRGSQPPLGQQRKRLDEPQMVARLLSLFPVDKSWVPVNKWASDMPEEIQEALVPFGGLGRFAGSQTNFFILRKENGINMISLSTMGQQLCLERARKERYEAKQREKYNKRR